jgi:hypothetical protein
MAAAGAAAGVGLPPKAPDLAEFQRQQWDLGSMGGLNLMNLSALASEVGPYTAPRDVPWEIIDAMGYDPVIYLGERAVSSVALDDELYFVRHGDPRVRARISAWLDPILRDLIRSIVSAFGYGVSPFVLSYEMADLHAKVDLEKGERKHSWPSHVHPKSVHPIWPGDAQVQILPNDELAALVHGGKSFEGRSADDSGRPLARRAFLPIWDPQWGRLEGMAARRRAYKPWYTAALISLWQGRYLERSVDVPRIGFAPPGMVNVNGEDVSGIRILTAALMSLKNGSACVVPSTQKDGSPLWAIDKLELPDRGSVWIDALGYYDAKKLESCLMPPGIANGEDVLSSAKVSDALMRDFVQGIADFVACELTKVVDAVYRFNGGKGAGPEVVANDVPQSRRKILLEILKATINSQQHLKDGRTYTLAELVHPELLEQLGIRTRSIDEAAHKPKPAPGFPGQPGPPRDTTGDRDARREAARTDEGEEATGEEGEGEE